MLKKQIIFMLLCAITTSNYTAYRHGHNNNTQNPNNRRLTDVHSYLEKNQQNHQSAFYPNYQPGIPSIDYELVVPIPPSEPQPCFCSECYNQPSALPAPMNIPQYPPAYLQVNDLSSMLHAFRDPHHPDSKLSLKKKEAYITNLLRNFSNEKLEAIQSNGQALVHEFSPWHWNENLINYLNNRRINLAVQTQEPDQYPGSTIAAIVICYVFKQTQSRSSTTIGSAMLFLTEYFNNYPRTLTLKSRSRGGSMIPCWSLLPPENQSFVYAGLNQEAQNIIKENFGNKTE